MRLFFLSRHPQIARSQRYTGTMRKTTLRSALLTLSLISTLAFAGTPNPPPAESDNAIITPGHAFSIKVPDRWQLHKTADVDTPALTPKKYKYPDSPVTIAIYSASKEIEKVANYKEFIAREVREAEKSNCGHRSSKPGKPLKLSDGKSVPTHMFVGDKYRYLDAYVEHADSVVVLSLITETQEQFDTAMPAFKEVVGSYIRLPELE